MNTSQTMVWKRRHRVRLRPLTSADRRPLEWIWARRARRVTVLEAPAGPQIYTFSATSPAQLAIECDQRLIGAALGDLAPTGPHRAEQPWGALDSAAPEPVDTAHQAPQGWLRGADVFWLDAPMYGSVWPIVARARLTLVQQLGLKGTYSLVDAVDYTRRSSMSPTAYLQQVHARAVHDQRLSPLLDVGYLMRGYYRQASSLQVVMLWDNRPH